MLETSERAFEAALRFNVTAAFLLTQLAVPHLAEHGEGAVVNISSRAASMVQPVFVAYATAKAALSMMTRALAPELAPKVRVNAIEVGGVETEALAHVLADDDTRRQLEDNTPMRRVGRPEDIAAAVVYLASPASSWVTGKIFEVDGGVESPAFTVPSAAAVARDVAPAGDDRQIEVGLDARLGLDDVRDRVHAVHRRPREPDLRVLADHGRVQAVERDRERRIRVELDLEALLAQASTADRGRLRPSTSSRAR